VRKIRYLVVPVLVTSLLSGACDGSSDPTRSAPSTPPSTPAVSPTQDRKDDDDKFDPSRVRIELELVVDGLDAPLDVTHAGDGSGRIFIVEQGGLIKLLDPSGRLDTFLDISNLTEAGGEQGLLGLAFHPDYRDSGLFYVNYTDLNGDTVVAEYRAPPAGDRADSSSARVLLTIDQPFSNHNGGGLAFGPDGFLYVATGDGGSGGDPMGNGQRLDTLLGKLLRIDVDGASPYSIPDDNPFAKDEGARPEIWAYGLRNPWRFSFDSASNTLWIGDVGQGRVEEIDRVDAGQGGLNFGWNEMEGDECFEGSCNPEDFRLPVAVYGRDGGACSVTGGHVYRGEASPALRGGYFFGDFCSGQIWALDAGRAGPQEEVELLDTDHLISSFGIDESGEIYVTDLGGGLVLHIVGTRD
jgi:glucose/arabinose dehydrogenase